MQLEASLCNAVTASKTKQFSSKEWLSKAKDLSPSDFIYLPTLFYKIISNSFTERKFSKNHSMASIRVMNFSY